MEKLLEKLSSYNILNNLIPGAAFIWLSELSGVLLLSSSSIVEKLFIYYFCGMIVSRVGSLVIEKICLKIKLISYASKKDYLDATKKDKLIEVLLETSNLYRTCTGMILTIGISKLYMIVTQRFEFSHELTVWIVIIVLFFLFVSAFCKQTKHILSRIEATKGDKKE